MKIIYNNILPPKGFTAINLFGLVLARKEYRALPSRIINHEAIHTAQMRELLFIFFYLWYVVEWIVRLIQYRNSNKAYHNISFEREAYANQDDQEYLKVRRSFSFLAYILN
ncbi:MAG: hypothetical protein ACK5MK_07630 [Dysgonomonas sp.]